MKKLAIVAFVGVVLLGLRAWVPTVLAATKHHFIVSPYTLYRADNELYFNNELPNNIEVIESEIPGAEIDFQKDGGIDVGDTAHQPGTHWYKIYISPTFNLTTTDERETVLHEACHVKMWEIAEKHELPYDGGHGPEWQACMLDLAKKGAFADLW